MTAAELIGLLKDTGLGGLSLALFFKLGKIVADHEIRIGRLETRKRR
jgi:hypothetical protein